MKKLLAILLALTLLFAFAACGKETAEPTKAPTEPSGTDTTDPTEETVYGEGSKAFTVIVIHKDGTKKTFNYKTDEQYVGKVLQESGLIKGNAGPYGLEITEVDGEKAVYAEDKAYWAVYEGEEYALQGIDTTPAVDGGIYKLVYTGA